MALRTLCGRMTPWDRFWAKVAVTPGCWLWTGGLVFGYGKFGMPGKTWRAHRFAWELLVGPIPPEMELDHAICQNKACVNPAHLELVPYEGRENSRRHAARITACPKGHPYDEANTKWKRSASGGWARGCRACENARHRERRARRTVPS